MTRDAAGLANGWVVSGPSLVVVVLILLFLVVPSALLLLEHLRGPRPRVAPALTAPAPGGVRLGDLQREEPVPALQAILVVARGTVETDFGAEGTPPVLAYVPPYAVVKGPVLYAGYLQVGVGALILGDVQVHGKLALASGAEVWGGVRVTGDLYVRPGARVRDPSHVTGVLHAESADHLDPIHAGSLRLERPDAPETPRRVAVPVRAHDPAPNAEERAA